MTDTRLTDVRATAPRPSIPKPTAAQGSWLVAQREITARLRSKAFLISTGILLVAVLASIVIGSIASASTTEPKVERSDPQRPPSLTSASR